MIGYTPQQVNQMSMWQFMVAVEGYVKAHTSDDGKLSADEVDDVWKWMQSKVGA